METETPLSRARWLQETRKMRFEEAYTGWQEGHLTQEDAARLLGVCERTFRRQIDRYDVAQQLRKVRLLVQKNRLISHRTSHW